jgi:hypothetical protein
MICRLTIDQPATLHTFINLFGITIKQLFYSTLLIYSHNKFIFNSIILTHLVDVKHVEMCPVSLNNS